MSCSLVFNPLLRNSPPAFSSSKCRPGDVDGRRSRVRMQAGGADQNSVKIQQQSQQQQQLGRSNGASQQQRMPMRRPVSPFSPLDMWDPFMPASRSFGQMLDAMNQIMETGPSMPTIQRRSSGRLPWDVMEDEDSFQMRVDMPGLARDEVKVSIVDDGFLLIKGETSKERREGDRWAARSVGSYESRVMLPENVEIEKIKAELKEGVLYVTVPKKKVVEKTPMEIQVS